MGVRTGFAGFLRQKKKNTEPVNTNARKPQLPISRPIPEAPPDPIETNLDPKVKRALTEMADKVRGRARERAKALEKDLSMLICDFVQGYGMIDPHDRENPNSHQYAVLKGMNIHTQGDSWQSVLEQLCRALGNHIAEIDVERCVQNLSAKILELDPME